MYSYTRARIGIADRVSLFDPDIDALYIDAHCSPDYAVEPAEDHPGVPSFARSPAAEDSILRELETDLWRAILETV